MIKLHADTELLILSLAGLAMAASRPWPMAMERKEALSRFLLGRPKDTLLMPRVVRQPIPLSIERALSVSRADLGSDAADSTTGSNMSSRSSKPISRAREMILAAIATFSSALPGMPFSSTRRQRTAAPYFPASPRTSSILLSSPVVELSKGFPAQAVRPASRARTSGLSMESGASTAVSTAVTARRMNSASSPGMPMFTSRTAAPASTWSMASLRTVTYFPPSISSARDFLLVGFILSPIRTKRSSPNSTILVLDASLSAGVNSR